MRAKSPILLLSLVVLAVLFSANIGISAPTEPTITAKVNISAESLKSILTGVQKVNQLTIHGTEYKAGEVATIFLQLKDQSNNPIINGSCYLDIFAPNKSSIISDAPMLYLAYSDGLYFYDYNLPPSTGLYMVSAKCTFSNFVRHYYTLTGGGWNPFEADSCGGELINGTVSTGGALEGAMVQLNNLMDWAYVYQASSAGGVKAVNTTFTWNATTPSCKINKTNTDSMNFYFMGETYNPQTVRFFAWNWNTRVWNLLGSVATAGRASASVTTGVEDYFASSINQSHINLDGSVRVQVYVSSGTAFVVWYDWLGLVATTNTTDMVDLKGSGELHVSGAEGVFEACSAMTDKERYLPNEQVRLTYFSGASPTRIKIILLNGSLYYDSGLMNGTGTFSYAFNAPSEEQSILLELLCGNSFAHKAIVIDGGFWDISFGPLIILFFALVIIIVLIFIGRYHQ